MTIYPVLLTIFCLFAILCDHETTSLGASTYIFMDVTRLDRPAESLRTCANFHPDLPRILRPARSVSDAIPYQLAYYDDSARCDLPNITNTSFTGKIVHTNSNFDQYIYRRSRYCRGNKSMSVNDKLALLESHNASAVLFLTKPYRTHASFYDPRINDSLVDIPIYYIDGETEKVFSKFVDPATASLFTLRFFIPDDPIVDIAMLVILLISLTCVAVGGAWSGQKHYDLYKEEVNKRLLMISGESSAQSVIARDGDQASASVVPGAPQTMSSGSSSNEPAAAPFNWITLVVFIVIVVGFLMLLYVAYSVVVWLTIVVYVIASSSSMCACFWYFVRKIPHCMQTFHLDPLADLLKRICRCCNWNSLRIQIEYRHAALYFFCLAFAIAWCVVRHWSYSYILHDILATCFSIVTIRNLRMSNLMWITSLLSLLLVYDLFMVFITPYMTKSGCSVMIDVATGGACSRSRSVTDATHNLPPSDSPREELPIVIRVPRYNDPVWSCYRMDVDLQYPPVILGLGDIILPGILIGYNAAYSLATNAPCRIYYVAGVIGYFVGMICTFAALLLSRLPQPALIYLVPAVLIPTHLIALARKEWKKMWKGLFPLIEESCPILKTPKETGQTPPSAQLIDPASENARLQGSHGTAEA